MDDVTIVSRFGARFRWNQTQWVSEVPERDLLPNRPTHLIGQALILNEEQAKRLFELGIDLYDFTHPPADRWIHIPRYFPAVVPKLSLEKVSGLLETAFVIRPMEIVGGETNLWTVWYDQEQH